MEEKRGYSHKHTRPLSVKVLAVYVIFLFAFYLFHFLYDLASVPATIFFGKIFSGPSAVFVDGAMIVLLGFVIYGIWKRTNWSWSLLIVWFSASILNAIFSLVFLQGNLLFVVKDVLLLSFMSVVLIDGFVLWYVVYRKKYFQHQPMSLKPIDKFFVYVLLSFWVIAILVMASFGLSYYKITKDKADKIISELQGSDFNSAMSICASKSGFDKDLCYSAVSAFFPNKPKDQVCSNVETDFYKVVCTQIT